VASPPRTDDASVNTSATAETKNSCQKYHQILVEIHALGKN